MEKNVRGGAEPSADGALPLTRRWLLQGTALAGAAVLAGGALVTGEALAEGGAGEAVPAEGVQYGFLVNTSDCIGCERCVEACRSHNKTPEGMPARRKVTAYASDFGKEVYVSTACMHCDEPACATVCPAHAISKRADGIVTVDSGLCIGCKYCYQACPYGVPHYGANGMDKCDCCLGAGILAGEEPYCAQACVFGGLKYGEIGELMASTGNTARRVKGETGPSYLML